MKSRILFFLLHLLLNATIAFGQKQDFQWVFGDSIGIDFNTSSPSVFYTVSHSDLGEGVSSISDKQGNLLFYVSGYDDWGGILYNYSRIFNSNNQIMTNGDSIYCHESVTQGTLIIPFPSDTNKYYIFSLQATPSVAGPMGLYYSIVDMSLNGGAGAVTLKNNLIITDTLSEKLTAVRHANGRDWWVLCRTFYGNTFYVLLITPGGIANISIQNNGTAYSPSLPEGVWGMMKFNQQGTKLAVAGMPTCQKIDLIEFDRCTGLLGKCDTLTTGNFFHYGCSFSSDGTKLYASDYNKLYQFDVNATNINSTATLIWNDSTSGYDIGQHLLAPDGKIYICSGYDITPNNKYTYRNKNLTVINNPDSVGTACNISPYSFYLGGKRCRFGLPNMVNYNLGALPGSPCDTLTAAHEQSKNGITFSVYPNPAGNSFTFGYSFSAPFRSVQLQVFNVQGVAVGSYSLKDKQGKKEIDASALASGVYFYAVVTDGAATNARGRVVVMH